MLPRILAMQPRLGRGRLFRLDIFTAQEQAKANRGPRREKEAVLQMLVVEYWRIRGTPVSTAGQHCIVEVFRCLART